MIKSLQGTGGIVVGTTSTPWINMSNPSAGTVRYNGNTSAMEVYDGSSWLTLSQSATVSLDYNAQVLLNWAQAKMAEEQRLESMAAKHPAVADALEAVRKAQEQVRIVTALVDTE